MKTRIVNRKNLAALISDVMRGFEDFDATLGWQQVAGKDDATQRRYGEFVMALHIAEHFDLDLTEDAS